MLQIFWFSSTNINSPYKIFSKKYTKKEKMVLELLHKYLLECKSVTMKFGKRIMHVNNCKALFEKTTQYNHQIIAKYIYYIYIYSNFLSEVNDIDISPIYSISSFVIFSPF